MLRNISSCAEVKLINIFEMSLLKGCIYRNEFVDLMGNADYFYGNLV